ncbi:translation initiation factor IF-3 [Paenibacillus radicis (ex Gao et al. 2016)]|uniref:Translation initiation factor IF-3 n=1 Tax=Paenibacillus radicis (ex Gao et al. 2016) TaxID=1737354 RepID=A0A917H474_9BACL|nr:translation initiation factor IF-3 [Paenibacillus radicis (ex Gao et al. 2016)]GGG66233.1 translation initiation factor IF-3 [Paenibacillus radicis (ex Gao et al. 2016)]
MILNEKIKASELLLTGLDGEELGIVSRAEALAMAKELKADLVCESLMSSPPPCKLMRRGSAKDAASKQKREEKVKEQPAKVKELRLSVDIEQHDYETKQRQAEKLLESGHAVLLVVRISGKEGPKAKALLEQLVGDLKQHGQKQTGIQVSGKQAAVQLNPN